MINHFVDPSLCPHTRTHTRRQTDRRTDGLSGGSGRPTCHDVIPLWRAPVPTSTDTGNKEVSDKLTRSDSAYQVAVIITHFKLLNMALIFVW